MTIRKFKEVVAFFATLVLYVVIASGIIWFAANCETRIGRLEKIIVDAGLWPAGEPAPEGLEKASHDDR